MIRDDHPQLTLSVRGIDLHLTAENPEQLWEHLQAHLALLYPEKVSQQPLNARTSLTSADFTSYRFPTPPGTQQEIEEFLAEEQDEEPSDEHLHAEAEEQEEHQPAAPALLPAPVVKKKLGRPVGISPNTNLYQQVLDDVAAHPGTTAGAVARRLGYAQEANILHAYQKAVRRGALEVRKEEQVIGRAKRHVSAYYRVLPTAPPAAPTPPAAPLPALPFDPNPEITVEPLTESQEDLWSQIQRLFTEQTELSFDEMLHRLELDRSESGMLSQLITRRFNDGHLLRRSEVEGEKKFKRLVHYYSLNGQ